MLSHAKHVDETPFPASDFSAPSRVLKHALAYTSPPRLRNQQQLLAKTTDRHRNMDFTQQGRAVKQHIYLNVKRTAIEQAYEASLPQSRTQSIANGLDCYRARQEGLSQGHRQRLRSRHRLRQHDGHDRPYLRFRDRSFAQIRS